MHASEFVEFSEQKAAVTFDYRKNEKAWKGRYNSRSRTSLTLVNYKDLAWILTGLNAKAILTFQGECALNTEVKSLEFKSVS